MGINIDRVISMTFALGSALAAAGGVLVGIYYNSIDPLMGMVPGIKAFGCRSSRRYWHYSRRYAGRDYPGRC